MRCGGLRMRYPWLAAGFAALASVLPAAAQQVTPPAAVAEAPVAEIIDIATDTTTRLTVPVSIGGSGPYGFIVDTGSERTVISSELAQRLGLGAGRTATMHSMTESSQVDTVLIPALEVGRRT